MNIIHPNRKKILAGIVCGTIIIAGFLTYNNTATQQDILLPQDESGVTSETAQKKDEPLIKKSVLGQEKDAPSDQQQILAHLDITPQNILWFTNYYRNQYGLKPLEMNLFLIESSSAKNDDMQNNDYFAHDRIENSKEISFDFFIESTGYRFAKIAENLAQGDFATSKEIVDAWMNSPSHKKNILDPLYTDIGINILTTAKYPSSTVLVTQHFGKPAAICPKVPAEDKERIEQQESNLSLLKQDIETLLKRIQKDNDDDATIALIISDYNKKIATYHNLVKETQSLISAYNEQISTIKSCMER